MKQETFVENAQGRHVDDFYRTPPEVTRALCDEFKLRGIEPRLIGDIGCGDGAIGVALRQAWPNARILGQDTDDRRCLLAHATGAYVGVGHEDWCIERTHAGSEPLYQALEYGLLISNPPFRYALPFLKLALERVQSGGHVAFLLISQWDQETVHDDERGKFLDSIRRPDGRDGYEKLNWKGRIDFRGDGKTDRVAYSWFVFGPGFGGGSIRIPRSPIGGSEQLQLGAVR